MFDIQRNLLTTLLAAGIGLLVVVGGALAILMGRPDVAAIAPQGDTEAADVQVDVPQTGLKDFSEYSAILEQPVFFSDRQLPVVEAPEEPQLANEEETEEPIQDLEATVAGIVITPEMRLAMISDEQAGKTMVLREGMSLEGQQAAWKLDAIEARQVSFVSVDGRQAQLELKINTAGLAAPAAATTSNASEAQQPDQQPAAEAGAARSPEAARQASDEARARAEEIRRRVAERRAQLRAEAERRARQRENKQDNNG